MHDVMEISDLYLGTLSPCMHVTYTSTSSKPACTCKRGRNVVREVSNKVAQLLVIFQLLLQRFREIHFGSPFRPRLNDFTV